MKKVFNKTVMLALLIALNLSILTWVVVVTSKTKRTNKYLPDFSGIPSMENNNIVFEGCKYYTLQQSDITINREYEAELYIDDVSSSYYTFNVTELGEGISVGKTITVGQLLGKNGGADVLSNKKGRIVSINSGEIKVFVPNSYILKAQVPQADYYYFDFEKEIESSFFSLSSEKRIKLGYIGVDFEKGLKNGFFTIEYSIDDDDCYIMPGVSGKLIVVEKTQKGAFLIDYNAFSGITDPINTEKTFLMKTSTGFTLTNIRCVGIDDYYFVVEGDNLSKGVLLYEYNK